MNKYSKRFTTFISTKRGFIHLFLLVIIVIIAVAGIGYYAFKRGQLPTISKTQNSTKSPSITPSFEKTNSRCTTLTARYIPNKPKHTIISSGQKRDRIIVTFANNTDIRLRDQKLVSLNNTNLESLNTVLIQFKVKIERLYDRPEAQLDSEQIAAEESGCKEIGDRNLAYLTILEPNQDTERFIDSLNALSVVEIAYPEYIIVNP